MPSCSLLLLLSFSPELRMKLTVTNLLGPLGYTHRDWRTDEDALVKLPGLTEEHILLSNRHRFAKLVSRITLRFYLDQTKERPRRRAWTFSSTQKGERDCGS